MLLFILLTACTDRTANRQLPPRGYAIHGIDVSHHQGWIDWPAVGEAGVEFAFIKATEGRGHVDSRFRENWIGATTQMPVGAYHYFSACQTGARQAAHFLRVVPEPGDLPPVLDIEVDGRCNREDRLLAALPEVQIWLDEVEDAHGKRPLVYASRGFHRRHLDHLDNDLWVASYGRRPGDAWTFWQYTPNGRVPGISGPVDRNVFDGDLLE